jgi:rhamnosyltransferase
MERIIAYITAYQDLEAIKKCINCLQAQTYPIEKILIIDNSPEKLESLYKEQENIIVQHHPSNIGISGGLTIALQWSIDNQYDFLWTFDQDSEPSSDTLEKLLFWYQKLDSAKNSIGMIAPLSIDIQSQQELEGAIWGKYNFVPASVYKNRDLRGFYQKEFYECDIVITSGSLVNLKVARNVELPDRGLFIDSVDWDYCMKFRKENYRIIVTTQAIMYHNFGNYVKDHLIGNNQIPIYSYSALRYFYTCRNHTFIESRLAIKDKKLAYSIIFRVKSLIKKIIKIILYENEEKSLKIWACIKGTFDGFIGRLGKTW